MNEMQQIALDFAAEMNKLREKFLSDCADVTRRLTARLKEANDQAEAPVVTQEEHEALLR